MEYSDHHSTGTSEDINDDKNVTTAADHSRRRRNVRPKPRPRSGIRVRKSNRSNSLSRNSFNGQPQQHITSSDTRKSNLPPVNTVHRDVYNYDQYDHQLPSSSSSVYNNNVYERKDIDYHNNMYQQDGRVIEEEYWKPPPTRPQNRRVSTMPTSASIDQRISDYKNNKKLEQRSLQMQWQNLQWQNYMAETENRIKSLEKENKRILDKSSVLQTRSENLSQEIIQLSSENRKLVHEIHDLKSRLENRKRENSFLENECSRLSNECSKLSGDCNRLSNECNRLSNEYNQLSSESQAENQQLKMERDMWMQRSGSADLLAQNLSNENRLLKIEATKYQSALGKAMNIRFDDNDNNSTVNLIKDITELQHTLRYFSQLKGKDIKINEENALNLLQQYDCQCDDPQQNKPMLSAVLQRHILEKILNEAAEFFQPNDSNNDDKKDCEDNKLEKYVVNNEVVIDNNLEKNSDNNEDDKKDNHLEKNSGSNEDDKDNNHLEKNSNKEDDKDNHLEKNSASNEVDKDNHLEKNSNSNEDDKDNNHLEKNLNKDNEDDRDNHLEKNINHLTNNDKEDGEDNNLEKNVNTPHNKEDEDNNLEKNIVTLTNNNEDDKVNYLEKNIVIKTKDLISMIHKFVETRHGVDNVSAVTPIHLRQQIYGLLSNRGFATTRNPHPFLSNLKAKVIEEINKYRTIINETRKQEQERRAENLVIETLRIFCFRLYAQEPPAQYMWIEAGSEVKPNMMEGPELGGDEDNLEVEVCSFPVIGVNSNDKDDAHRQIYSKAKVYTRERKSNSEDHVVTEVISDAPPQP
ncbi:2439_t:CDS:1, partial [Ambispora leptoticha]